MRMQSASTNTTGWLVQAVLDSRHANNSFEMTCCGGKLLIEMMC